MSVKRVFDEWLGQKAGDWPDAAVRRVRDALALVDEIAAPDTTIFDQIGDWLDRARAASAPHEGDNGGGR